jgi:DNA-binding SARP family transcriptional activator
MQPTRLFTLHMLGPLEIRVGERLPALRRKERALLAYLAATERAHQRRALADMFCQEADAPDRALRLLLSRIRHELHPLALILDGAAVRFDPQIGEVDFLAFTRGLEGDLSGQTIAALEAAVTLYRGELLASLNLADAPEFELWLLGERARLRLLYERGLNELVSRLIATSQHAAAIERARQLLQSNPLLEEAHAQLIWLYAQTGQRSAALHQFALCRDLLQRELAVEPAPALRALHAEVAAGQLGPRAAPSPAAGPAPADWRKPAVYVGREAELEQLRRAWEGVRHGRTMVVLIEAEAGGGKTRLVHEFAGRAGLRLLSGRCSESMAPLPYHPWIEVLEEYRAAGPSARLDQLSPFARDYLARLVPGLARRSRSAPPAAPTAGGEIERLFTAILEYLEQGGPAPLAIFIDDLQWIDETSLRLFHFIATRAQRMRLLLIGTLRSAEADDAPALQTLLHDLQRQPVLHLQLAALGEESIQLLIAQGWPALPEAHHAAAAAMLAQATQGNALFVTEIIAELAHTTQVPSELPIPASVRELVQRRFRQLPPSGRQALEGLAVLASPATLTQAQLISGRGEE